MAGCNIRASTASLTIGLGLVMRRMSALSNLLPTPAMVEDRLVANGRKRSVCRGGEAISGALRRITGGHFSLVSGKSGQDFLRFRGGNLEHGEGSRELGGDFIELSRRNPKVAVGNLEPK